eukprot:GEMP01064622.1.p1 GENE.GEMP01064622.1~~GEMP01064622.1.p1  ORF type:complete len:232 (+),score=67.37 GEMP01064622.1:178-873(+)
MIDKDEHVFKVETDNLEYTFGASSSQAEPSPTKLTANGFNPDDSADKCTPRSGRFTTPRSFRSDTSFDFTFGPGGHPCAQSSPVERSWDCANGNLAKECAREAADDAPALAVDAAQNLVAYPSTGLLSAAQETPAPISYFSKIADASYSSDPGITPYCPVPPVTEEQTHEAEQEYAATQEQYAATQEQHAATQLEYEAAQQEYEAVQQEYEAVREQNALREVPSSTCCTIL